MCGVHDIISGKLWWSRQVSPTCSASKPCGSDYIRMTSAVEETGTIGCVRCYLKSFSTCRLTFVLQHYSTFTFCLYFCSCWLSLTNGAIWAFVAPALFVIVVRKLELAALIVWLCYMTYTLCRKNKMLSACCLLSAFSDLQVNIGILISVTRIISRISGESYKIHGDANAVKCVFFASLKKSLSWSNHYV